MSTDTARFEFPAIFEFPPFFTRQINEQTWQSQLASWDSLILSYCKHHKIWKLSIDNTNENENENDSSVNNNNVNDDLFANARINRKLNQSTIKQIFEYMIDQGHGEWQKKGAQSEIYVYFKRPEEWASDIKQWVDSTGQNSTVLTFYELSHGDLVTTQDFAGIDPAVLRKAIDILVSRNQAVILKASDGQIMGVKIL